MKSFNGHRSWNAWNVSLWLSNDERTYNYMYAYYKKHGLKDTIRHFVNIYGDGQRTPDGAVYNALSVKLAVEGLMEGYEYDGRKR